MVINWVVVHQHIIEIECKAEKLGRYVRRKTREANRPQAQAIGPNKVLLKLGKAVLTRHISRPEYERGRELFFGVHKGIL